MTLKYDDLVVFMRDLNVHYEFPDEISRQYLDHFTAMKFGASEYILENIAKTLVYFGFLKIKRPGIFKICEPWTPPKVKK